MNFFSADVEIKVESRGLPAQLARVKSLTTRAATGIERAFKRMATKVISSVTRMVKYAVAGLLALGVAAIKMASDVQESENLYEVSMGNMADATRQWSKEMSDALYLNEYDVRRSVATFNVMFDSMGMSAGAAADMSKALTQLSYDMASFYNLKPAEAFQKLQAGITGESEPLKRLGILINETTVKQYALNNAIWDGVGSMTELEKVQARYLLILSQTAKAQGDMERTLDSSQNVFRAILTQVKLLVVALGEKLLIAIQDVSIAMRDWLVKDKEAIIVGMIRAVQGIVSVTEILVDSTRKLRLHLLAIKILYKEIYWHVANLAKVSPLANIVGLFEGYESPFEKATNLKKEIDELNAQMDELAEAYVRGIPKVNAFFDSILDGLERAEEATVKTTKTIREQYADALRARIAQIDIELAKIKEVSDLTKRLIERDKDIIIKAAQDEADFVRSQDYLTRQQRIQHLQDYVAANAEALNLVKEANKILTDELERLELIKWSGLRRWVTEAGDWYLQLDRIAVRAFDGMADALTDMAMRGKADFKALARSVIADLTRMMIKQQMYNVLAAAGLGGEGGNWFGAITSALFGTGGGALKTAPVQPPGQTVFKYPDFHDGGTVEKTGWAKVHKGETFSGVGGAGGVVINISNVPEGYTISEEREYMLGDQRIIDVSMQAAAGDGGYMRAHNLR